jgi:formylglycine-generating enzyme required for sulfatase activity
MSARAPLGILGATVLLAVLPPAASADPAGEPERALATPGDAKVDGMVHLPGGTFRAGEPTGPRNDTVTYHRVRAFLLDVTEVTVEAYVACVKAGKCTAAAATVSWDAIREPERTRWSAYCNRDRPDRADHPVNCVDWSRAAAYCAWRGKRLPAEEEWEWAARNARQGTRHPWGNEAPGPQPCWNGAGNDVGQGNRDGTCAVGSHPAGDSAAGVKDLAGNVWEWTSSATVLFADSRGRGGTPAKIARGGGWADTDPANVSATVRFADLQTLRSADVGFRCARSP